MKKVKVTFNNGECITYKSKTESIKDTVKTVNPAILFNREDKDNFGDMLLSEYYNCKIEETSLDGRTKEAKALQYFSFAFCRNFY